MADVLNYGGDGGNEPPHQHANRLQTDCQTAPAAKKRGRSRSLHLVKMFQSNGKKPLPIDFDTKEGTYLPIGENQKYLSRVVGTHEFFDVNPRRYSKADYKLIVDYIEDIAARRYRQYKAKVNAYIRDKGTTVPYRGLTADVWEKCIERSSSKKFKQDRQTQEWPSVIETFKVNHQRNGEWVNERAAQDYEKMVEEREEQTQQASSSGVAVNERDVVLKVLGERRGHRRAVGRVLKGHFPLSLVQYDIAGPTQYQSIYSGNQCIEVQNRDIHVSNE
ncbi:Uncharacterized protein Adt_07483 [Abeliophyllum distichum]|uniref:Uncharacterized protein n=1 Tax=Abeliophyllum distichum TaxID=126358 RepID=A0ABD1V9W0_9LAMI